MGDELCLVSTRRSALYSGQRVQFSSHQTTEPLFHALTVFHVAFCLFACCHVHFSQEQLLSGHSPLKPVFVKCCRDCCPSDRFSHLNKETLQFYQSSHWVLGHLPDLGDSCPVPHFGWLASSKKSLGSSIFFPFPNDRAYSALGNF